ncbi:MAG: YcaO-like family protein [Peptococcaceae bacterium]|nr:YcaO-like family protein [Peptococcaceae bacterium]
MREWSTYCQNADYLEKSRMLIMNRDMAQQVVEWIGLKPGDTVLDVGCGSGELTFYLANVTEQITYTGVDLDVPFLERAQQKADAYTGSCKLSFVQGNALELPFADASFDVVVSQTLFTSIADYEKVMQEMRRVCRPGGHIASLTPLSFSQMCTNGGNYPTDATWAEAYQLCVETLDRLYAAYGSMTQYVIGIVPGKVPELFARAGLEHVCAYPIGTFLSLSNAAMTEADKRRYITLDYQAELAKFQAHMQLPGAQDWVSAEEAQQILDVFAQRRDYLLAHLDDNAIWEWIGNTFLLVVGEHTTQQDPAHSDEQVQLETFRIEANVYKTVLQQLGLDIQEQWYHSGAGRTAVVTLTIAGTDVSARGVGITPVHAMVQGYRTLVGLLATGAFGRYDTALWHGGELLSPDAQLLNAEALEQLGGALLVDTLHRAAKGPGAPLIDLRTAAQKLHGWQFAAKDGQYVSLPFTHMSDGTVQWLPEVLCSAYYGNNGIGVGRTEDEAMVYGLCRIAEKYATRKILLEGQTPPLLPIECLEQLPAALQEAICALQHSKTCNLRLMDASCGMGLPVVAGMLIDRMSGKALVRFGAHPQMTTALEDCVAALLADWVNDKPATMMPVAINEKNHDNYPRRFNLMQDGLDVYPASIIAADAAWELAPWRDAAPDSAGQLEQLMTLYGSLGWDVYVRRCDFLGVPAVQVIVPGISMLHDFGTVRMQERRMAKAVQHSLRNMVIVDAEARKRAAMYAKLKLGWREESSFAALSGIAYTPLVLGVQLDASMISALMQLQQGDYDEALSVLKQIAHDRYGKPTAVQVLCQAVEAIQTGAQLDQIEAQLRVLYPKLWVEEAVAIVRNPLGALPALACPDCQNCSVQCSCNMPQTVQLIERLHQHMQHNKSEV